MTEKALKALRGSIKKWEKIVNGKGEDNAAANCPLCEEFLEENCVECPIAIITVPFCEASPYVDWCTHQYDIHNKIRTPHIVICPRCKKLAGKELKFLQKLLPKV